MVLFSISTFLPLSIPSKPGNVSGVPSLSNPQHTNAAQFFFNSNVFTRAYLTMFYKLLYFITRIRIKTINQVLCHFQVLTIHQFSMIKPQRNQYPCKAKLSKVTRLFPKAIPMRQTTRCFQYILYKIA